MKTSVLLSVLAAGALAAAGCESTNSTGASASTRQIEVSGNARYEVPVNGVSDSDRYSLTGQQGTSEPASADRARQGANRL